MRELFLPSLASCSMAFVVRPDMMISSFSMSMLGIISSVNELLLVARTQRATS